MICALLMALILNSLPFCSGQQTTVVTPADKTQRAENLPDDINRGFLDPKMDPEEYIKRFEVESREVFSQRRAIVEALELSEGMAVADVGAGTGLFLKPLSVGVGKSGSVLAVDISPSFVKHLRTRIQSEELSNAKVIFCSDRQTNLDKNSVDRMLVCDTYHHFEYPSATVDSMYQALRPGGILVLVDFHRQPENVSSERTQWLMGHVRAPLEVFRQEIEAAGFRFKDQPKIEGFTENYLLRFTKPK